MNIICTALLKAFDQIDHRSMRSKLHTLGVTGNYLTGRSFSVKLKIYVSNEYEIMSGVPKGSHLSPLFLNPLTI